MTPDIPNGKRPRRLLAALLLATVAGGVAFTMGVTFQPEQTWKVFLVNFLFWSGVSIAGPVFAAILELTQARWATAVRPAAESLAGFLPVSLLLYAVLLRGASFIYPWIARPPQEKIEWFSFSSFVLRDSAALLLLYGLGFAFFFASRRKRRAQGGRTPSLSALAVVFLIVYALGFSLISIDLVMSLSPSWVSTLFPAYFFVGNLYAGIAATCVAGFLRRRATGMENRLDAPQASDMGKILFGFSMLWLYLFWSQYLVIWFGDLPEETGFLLLRIRGVWSGLSWTVLVLCFLLPFVALMGRALKRPTPLSGIALAAMAGLWMERFLLVMPSATQGPAFGWLDGLVTLGFGTLFALAHIVTLSD